MRFWSVEQFLFNEHSGTFWNMWPRNKKQDFYTWPYVQHLVLWILIVLRAEIQILKSFIYRISSSLSAKLWPPKGIRQGHLKHEIPANEIFGSKQIRDERTRVFKVCSRQKSVFDVLVRIRSVTKSRVRKSKSCSSFSSSDRNGFGNRINHRWIRVRHWEKLKSSSKITNLVDMQVFLNSKMQNFLVTYQDGPLLRNDLEIIYS